LEAVASSSPFDHASRGRAICAAEHARRATSGCTRFVVDYSAQWTASMLDHTRHDRKSSPPPLAPRLAAPIGSVRWILSLAALTAISALSIDMSLPAQPTIARDLDVSADVAQLTLSLFVVGFAIGQLIYGHLADAYGRRPVLLTGLLVYSAAAVGCAAHAGIVALLACRLVQGAGAACGPVVARAMVRDTQPAASAARLLSLMLAVLALAPMLAPLAGAFVLARWGWHAIFTALAVSGLGFVAMTWLSLPETLPPERRVAVGPRSVARGLMRFFRTPGTRIPTLLGCFSFAGQFAYISDSPFVLIDGYGVAPDHYGLYFGATALALMAGSMLGGRLLRRRAPARVLVVGGAVLCSGGLLVAAGTQARALGLAGFIAPMLLYFVGLGLLGPSATALAMDPVPEIAGTASATIGFLQMTAGALSGYVTTRLGGSDPRPLGIVVALMGAVAATLALATGARAARAHPL
jgi:DHA1 family bicyclomycin/chloramphenicol resistance-like MFS transporter